jgi:hypothetical protein
MQDEIAAVVEACGKATLKVILEVSELETYDNIRAASFLAMRVIRPNDFIKTSTGKTSSNATLGNNQVMLEAIRDHFLATGVPIAMKPAGGIRTAKQALHFLIAVKETLGDEWLNNRRYRFGASALLNDLVRQLEKERTGAYQAPWNFSDATELGAYSGIAPCHEVVAPGLRCDGGAAGGFHLRVHAGRGAGGEQTGENDQNEAGGHGGGVWREHTQEAIGKACAQRGSYSTSGRVPILALISRRSFTRMTCSVTDEPGGCLRIVSRRPGGEAKDMF